MLTYKMKFNAKIESIDIESRQIVVEYFDPHGNKNLRVALSFKFDATSEEIKQLIINNTPHKFFHDTNEEIKAIKKNKIDHEQLKTLIGESLEYRLPKFNNEVI
jgi:hypothetical protein